MKIVPNPKVKVKKSASAKKEDKYYQKHSIPDSQRKRHYKVKVKATDPQARAGGFSKMKVTEISEKKAEKLKSKKPRKDVENPGKLNQNVTKQTGLSSMERIKGSKVAGGKSNLNMKGKMLSIVAGKKKVGMMEAKKPGNQFEKGTKGMQVFVGTKNPEPAKIKKLKAPNTIKRDDLSQFKNTKKITPIDIESRTEETANAQKKPVTSSGTSVARKTAVTNRNVGGGSAKKSGSGKKYFVKINGQEKSVDPSDPRYKKYFKK